jgi:hypothetical protein
MNERLGNKREMPDVPKFDFLGALAEIWFQINYSAYHMAYVRVYSGSGALRMPPAALRVQAQDARDNAQIDVVICRTHLAAFFWHIEHLFEALRTAVKKGKQDYPDERYFWTYDKHLDKIDELTIRKEIKDYRNLAHETPGIIGCKWSSEDHLFLYHFLPTIAGYQDKEHIELSARLQEFFEFAANVWLEFAPSELKDKFPRDFRFPITIPYMFEGELPDSLIGIPQLEVQVNSYEKEPSTGGSTENREKSSPT